MKFNYGIPVLTIFACLSLSGMQNGQLPVIQEITVAQRVAAFNEWKKDPQIAQRLNSDEAGTVQAYIHLTMMMHEPEEKATSPAHIAHATQFARTVCPSYRFWDEYYECYRKCQRGKCYSHEENVALILSPIMAEINRLKMMRVLLKQENPHLVANKPDWKQERELAGIKNEDSRSLMVLIPRVLPVKNQELEQLKKEVEESSIAENLEKMLEPVKQLWQAKEELPQVRMQLNVARAKFEERRAADDRIILEQAAALKTLEDKANDQRVALEGMQHQLHVTQAELHEKTEKLEQDSKRLKDIKASIMSLYVIFQRSDIPGWESLFAQAVKAELEK